MMQFTVADRWILLILLGVSLVTHLAGLAWPPQVVFDEVHFGKFITAYCCTGERFFDIHPPHAKLLIAGAAWLGGYRGGFSFETIGQSYGDTPVVALRSVPAMVGVLLPLLLYLLARQLGTSSVLAGVVGAAAVLDNALTIQTRIIALDGVLLLATFGSVSAYLAARQSTKPLSWLLVVLAGVLVGLAVGTKFTGLAALGIVGVLVLQPLLTGITKAKLRRSVRDGAIILLSAILVYLGGWALHFALLPLPGSGDAFHVPESLLPPQEPTVWHFLVETIELHRVMLSANYNLTASHPNASPWWSWPMMHMPVFYWTNADGLQQIYFVGNPVVWWGGTILFIVAVLVCLVQFGQRRRPHTALLWVACLGFCVAMFPLVRVPRALFLYHYLTPLYFSVLAGVVWLDRTFDHHAVPKAQVRKISLGIIGLMLIGFLVVSPFTYGYTLAKTTARKDQLQRIMLFWIAR